MRFVVLISLIFGFAVGSAAEPQDVSPSEVVRYLGLAVPFPVNAPETPMMIDTAHVLYPAEMRVWLTVDSSGSIRDMRYSSDSAAYIDPIKPDLDTVRFQFAPGRNLASPLSIPVRVTYSGRALDGWSVDISFPISARFTTDSLLLRDFFSANGVEPPRIVSLAPVYYAIKVSSDNLHYWTITAQVALDAQGKLQDISYPIAGQTRMRHQVHVALMHAGFSPARLQGKPFATDFLVTFRIFDNIDYPFSPFQQSDTAEAPIASRYFMTYYYSENDIFIHPLPRKPRREILRSPKYGMGNGGFSEVTIDIDTCGKVTGVRVGRTMAGLRQVAAKTARLLDWYPAVDAGGQPVKYTGRLRLDFSGTTKIVYIPEWLP